MYGKHFSTMYEGSMVGSGAHVFAVWGYCISNADPDSHTVRLNPKLLATILGESEDRVQSAIDYLCSPDPDSQCTLHDGRRLLNTSGMEYLVVSHHHYREIKNGSDRREYMRKYMKNYRGKADGVNNESLQSLQKLTPVSVYVSESVKDGSQEGRFTLEDCKKAAGVIGMKPEQIEKFFHHFNALGWMGTGGRRITNLSSQLAKWKANEPSIGKSMNKSDDDIRAREKAMDEARRKQYEDCYK